jgi:uncharacterized protein YdeI (YjbR/CyaY-like superfamily)
MELVEPDNLAEWRSWLEANHNINQEIWLVLQKGGKKDPQLTMTEAVDEALCFGWIDSRTKRLDDVRYMLRLTPRKVGAKWSNRNLQRAKDLIAEGRMTDAGKMKLPNNFLQSVASSDVSSEDDEDLPQELEISLKREANIWTAFIALKPGKRKEFIRWVSSAKRPETREKRILRTIELIGMGRSLNEEMMNKWTKR